MTAATKCIEKISVAGARFRTSEQVAAEIKAACGANSDVAALHELGPSEAGRPVCAVVLGNGPKTVSLLAGAHSDEPVGPETLRTFILEILKNKTVFSELLSQFKFVIVSHINPDGEAQNQAWIKKWPDIAAYLCHAFRELPGRDLEFGYPDMRQENCLVSTLLKKYAPFSLHMSLHGMGFSDGLLLLIEKHWIARSENLQNVFKKVADDLNFRLHDHDRKGEKGFQYIGPGFTTTPEGQAMRAYFKKSKEPETSQLFRDSSMEFVRSLGGDPLCLVTELPMFMIRKAGKLKPGVPSAYLEFKQAAKNIRLKLLRGKDVNKELERFQLESLSLELQMKIQLRIVAQGLTCLNSKK